MAGLLVREPASMLLPVPDGLRSLPSSWKRAPLISMAIQVNLHLVNLHVTEFWLVTRFDFCSYYTTSSLDMICGTSTDWMKEHSNRNKISRNEDHLSLFLFWSVTFMQSNTWIIIPFIHMWLAAIILFSSLFQSSMTGNIHLSSKFSMQMKCSPHDCWTWINLLSTSDF